MSARKELEPFAAPYDANLDDHHSHEFPFTRPNGSQAHMFIQWKGTNVCLDFWCECGTDGHYDGGFAYHLKCPACGQVYEMGTQVIARKVDGDDHPSTQVLDVDEEDMPVLPVHQHTRRCDPGTGVCDTSEDE